MSQSEGSPDEILDGFRATLDHLLNEHDGLLLQQPQEMIDHTALNSAVAELKDRKRSALPHITQEEAISACMTQLLHGFLQQEFFTSLPSVQEALSRSLDRISQKSDILSPLFDRHHLHDRPIDFASMDDLLQLPHLLYERRPRPSPTQRQKRRRLIGYPSLEEPSIVWKTQMTLTVADVVHKYYDGFEACVDAVLTLLEAFEPLAFDFEPALTLFWIDLFLDSKRKPTWLTCDIVQKKVRHYEFDTSMELYAKISFIPTAVIRSYLTERFLEINHAGKEYWALQISHVLLPPNCIGRVLNDTSSQQHQTHQSTDDSKLIQWLEPYRRVPQLLYPVVVHIKRLLYQDCFDQAVSFSRRVGELDEDTCEIAFNILFVDLIQNGRVFYNPGEPVLESLFYNFNLFAGERGFHMFACFYRTMYHMVERTEFADVKTFVQLRIRQTLLHLAAARYSDDIVLQIYARYLPVPSNLLLESLDQRMRWMKNFLIIKPPAIPDRFKSNDDSSLRLCFLLRSAGREDSLTLYDTRATPFKWEASEADGSPVPEKAMKVGQTIEISDFTSGNEIEQEHMVLPGPVTAGKERFGAEMRENEKVDTALGGETSVIVAGSEPLVHEAEGKIYREKDAVYRDKDAEAYKSHAHEEVYSEGKDEEHEHSSHQRTETDDDNESLEFFDAETSSTPLRAEPDHVRTQGDKENELKLRGDSRSGNSFLFNRSKEDDHGHRSHKSTETDDANESLEFFDAETTSTPHKTEPDHESIQNERKDERVLLADSRSESRFSEFLRSRDMAESMSSFRSHSVAGAGDEAYFAEESQVSEGEEEPPRTETRHRSRAEASMAGYDADATDNEEGRWQDPDGKSRRHRAGGYASSSAELDGYDGGVSQGHTEEEDEEPMENSRHSDKEETPPRRRTREQHPLSDAMSAADEFTTEAEESELDDRDFDFGLTANMPTLPVKQMLTATLYEHAVAAQDHFSALDQANEEVILKADSKVEKETISRENVSLEPVEARPHPGYSPAFQESVDILDQQREKNDQPEQKNVETSEDVPEGCESPIIQKVLGADEPTSEPGKPIDQQKGPIHELHSRRIKDEHETVQISQLNTPVRNNSQLNSATMSSSQKAPTSAETPLRRSARKRKVKLPYIGDDVEASATKTESSSKRSIPMEKEDESFSHGGQSEDAVADTSSQSIHGTTTPSAKRRLSEGSKSPEKSDAILPSNRGSLSAARTRKALSKVESSGKPPVPPSTQRKSRRTQPSPAVESDVRKVTRPGRLSNASIASDLPPRASASPARRLSDASESSATRRSSRIAARKKKEEEAT